MLRTVHAYNKATSKPRAVWVKKPPPVLGPLIRAGYRFADDIYKNKRKITDFFRLIIKKIWIKYKYKIVFIRWNNRKLLNDIFQNLINKLSITFKLLIPDIPI